MSFFGVSGDAIGATDIINNIPYSWPSSQGSLYSYLRNDGSGNLNWQSVIASTRLDFDVSVASSLAVSTPQVLKSFVVPANTLQVAGDILTKETTGTQVAGTTVTYALIWDGTTIATFSYHNLYGALSTYVITGDIHYVTAGNQICHWSANFYSSVGGTVTAYGGACIAATANCTVNNNVQFQITDTTATPVAGDVTVVTNYLTIAKDGQ